MPRHAGPRVLDKKNKNKVKKCWQYKITLKNVKKRDKKVKTFFYIYGIWTSRRRIVSNTVTQTYFRLANHLNHLPNKYKLKRSLYNVHSVHLCVGLKDKETNYSRLHWRKLGAKFGGRKKIFGRPPKLRNLEGDSLYPRTKW